MSRLEIFTLVKPAGVGSLPAEQTDLCQKRRRSLSSDIGPCACTGCCDLRRGAAKDAPSCRRSESSSATEQRAKVTSTDVTMQVNQKTLQIIQEHWKRLDATSNINIFLQASLAVK